MARLARGPGCVTVALGLDRRHDGLDVSRGPVWVADADPDLPGARDEEFRVDSRVRHS